MTDSKAAVEIADKLRTTRSNLGDMISIVFAGAHPKLPYCVTPFREMEPAACWKLHDRGMSQWLLTPLGLRVAEILKEKVKCT